jgi:putative transposase
MASRRSIVKDPRTPPLSLESVDQDGDVLDIMVQSRKDKKAAKKFFRKLLKGSRFVPSVIITDKLENYSAAKVEILPRVEHCQQK